MWRIIPLITGSSDIWIPDADCGSCESHEKFDPDASSTYKDLDSNFQIMYGSGPVEGMYFHINFCLFPCALNVTL